MEQQEIIQLLDRYLAGTASEAEQLGIDAWLDGMGDADNEWERMNEAERTNYITSLYQKILSGMQVPGAVSDKSQADDTAPGVSFGRPQADTVSRSTRQHGVSRSGPRVIQMYWKYIAAASVIIIASLIVILNLSKNDNRTKPAVAQTKDIAAPTETRAVITLADGRKVYLDSVSRGTIAQENNVNVVKTADGKIIYDTNAVSLSLAKTIAYNTLSNPRGSKVISLTLSDGTKVWLNSESSLRYPASFSAPDSYRGSAFRDVEITGEAYFEVKHNSKQPFKVHLPNGSIVEDIGTAFNINSYSDENDIKTTLIEGSVRIFANSASSAVTIKPGEQAIVSNPANPLIRKILVQTEAVTAWKDNKFYFDGADIKTIARQLSRWYDVDVEIRDNITNHFTGVISRSVNVSKVFDMLAQTGVVHFSVEGKKMIVSK